MAHCKADSTLQFLDFGPKLQRMRRGPHTVTASVNRLASLPVSLSLLCGQKFTFKLELFMLPNMADISAVLPQECWMRIFESLPAHDLWQCLFVSKYWNALATPYQYREISWTWHPIPIQKLFLLIRTVLSHPKRTYHIRHVHFLSDQKVDSTESWEPPMCATDCTKDIVSFKDIMQWATGIIKHAKFPDAPIWIQELEDGNPYAYVSVLLSQLHNLRSLHLDYSFVWQSGFPGLMLHHALFSQESTSLSRFNFLTDVDYGGNVRRAAIVDDVNENLVEEGYPLCNPRQFLPWFHLPSLRSLSLWARTRKILDTAERRPDLSQLRHLALVRATLQEDQLPELLSLCSSLEVLHLGMAYKWRREIALQNGSAIIQALKSVSWNITNLSFGLEYYPPNIFWSWVQFGEEDLSIPFYGILNEFPHLRYVEFPIELLVGWSTKPWSNLRSVLPKTVEKICLRGDYEPLMHEGWHERSILDLIANNVVNRRVDFPGLKHIVIHKWRPLYEKRTLAKKRAEVREICQGEGVELEVVCDGLSTGLWVDTKPRPERVIC